MYNKQHISIVVCTTKIMNTSHRPYIKLVLHLPRFNSSLHSTYTYMYIGMRYHTISIYNYNIIIIMNIASNFVML